MNLTINRKLRHLLIQDQIAGTGDVVDPISSGMITMILGMGPFKDLAVIPKIIAFNTMTLQMDANAFAQFRFVEPSDLLINFLMLTNESNGEIVSPKAENLEISH